MIKELVNFLEDKKILILGYGMEGKSTYHFLREKFPEKQLFIADKNTQLLENNPELIEDMHVEVILGEEYLRDVDYYDLIIKAPGISLKDFDVDSIRNKLVSQLELFLRFVKVFSIGITGTKGKSTTSSLMYKVLADQNKDVYLLGNIGEPIFNDIDRFTENTIAVIELSSHALEFVNHSTNIAILLDIFEEHLDHYKSLNKYIEAKFNVAKYQKEDDILVYNFDNEFMNNYGFEYKEKDIGVTMNGKQEELKNQIYIENEEICFNGVNLMNINEQMNLKGMHNINDIMFVLAVAYKLGLNIENAVKSIKEFKPLEHRMEYVATINEVEYYNDSIATIPESTINAINALKNIGTILVGGNDRGVDLASLINFLKDSDIENIICLPKTGEYIKEGLFKVEKNVVFFDNLKDATEYAKKVTKPGKKCLLSPAASSYGYFKNFEERGKLFKEYVNN